MVLYLYRLGNWPGFKYLSVYWPENGSTVFVLVWNWLTFRGGGGNELCCLYSLKNGCTLTCPCWEVYKKSWVGNIACWRWFCVCRLENACLLYSFILHSSEAYFHTNMRHICRANKWIFFHFNWPMMKESAEYSSNNYYVGMPAGCEGSVMPPWTTAPSCLGVTVCTGDVVTLN